MLMKIKNKIVNTFGKITGYLVESNDTETVMPVDFCINNINLFENVEIDTYTGYLKGINGHKIIAKSIEKEIPIVQSINNTNTAFINEIKQNEILGADLIKFCRKVRNACITNKIIVDTTEHNANNGYNTHLFKFIELCDLDVKQFILNYLLNMQPCTLIRKTQIKQADLICIYDTHYKFALYLKFKSDGSLIVSFHEDNVKGKLIKSTNVTTKQYAYLFGTTKSTTNIGEVAVNIFGMARGLSTFQLKLISKRISADLYIVKTSDLYNCLDDIVAQYITNLSEMYMTQVAILQTVPLYKILSFTSYGGLNLNILSLLCDLYSVVTVNERKNLFDVAEYVVTHEIDNGKLSMLLDALELRYMKSQNNAMLLHIKTLLHTKINEQKQLGVFDD